MENYVWNEKGGSTWTTLLAYNRSKNSSFDIYEYEAFLCQCSYLSRLAYVPCEIFCRMTKFLDVSPDAFNDLLTLQEGFFYPKFDYHKTFDSEWLQKQNNYTEFFKIEDLSDLKNPKDQKGMFYQTNKNLNMYFYIHENTSSKFNNKKTLFIIFKGSSSFDDFVHDAKAAPVVLNKLPYLDDLDENCKVHKGFVDLLEKEMESIVSIIREFYVNHTPERIVITGHSLGGALASLLTFALSNGIKNKKIQFIDNEPVKLPIHLITFGAPLVFGEKSRVLFNQHLTDSLITFDRIDAQFDFIPTIPPGFNHPGFNILKTEIFNKEKVRTEDIGELRKKFNPDLKPDNDLPMTENFLKYFNVLEGQNISVDAVRNNLKSLGGTKKENRKLYFPICFPAIKKTDEQIIEGIVPEPVSDELIIVKEQADVPSQEGGAIGFTKYGKIYKEITVNQMPNRIIYNCNKILCGGFCHAAYMGVGYLGGLRIPSVHGRKKEPRDNYRLVYSTTSDRLYSVLIEKNKANETEVAPTQTDTAPKGKKDGCVIC